MLLQPLCPSANVVILLELYCGTITEPGFPVSKPAGGFDKGISYIISSLSCSLAMLAGPCAAHMVCIVTPSIWAYPPMFLWFAIQSGCTYSTDDVLVTVLEFSFEGLPLLWCYQLDIIYKNN